jgi:AraC-like DNA-binding protein
MGEILEIAKSGGDAATVSAKIAPILLSLIEALCSYYKERKAESPALTAKERIDALGGAPFSPSALAEEMHISLSTLTRIFQSAYGCTPYEYHLSHKEKIAKSLLENTSLSAKEIAYRLGFSDAHYFSNFFKKRTGIRPAEYKKRNASH